MPLDPKRYAGNCLFRSWKMLGCLLLCVSYILLDFIVLFSFTINSLYYDAKKNKIFVKLRLL